MKTTRKKEQPITAQQLSGDYKAFIISKFGISAHKEIIVRIHVTPTGLLHTFIEVYSQKSLIYSGQSLEEALDMYNTH